MKREPVLLGAMTLAGFLAAARASEATTFTYESIERDFNLYNSGVTNATSIYAMDNAFSYDVRALGPVSVSGGSIPKNLLVILPGTDAVTADYTNFRDRAKLVGYHTIILPYWNLHHLHLLAGCDTNAWGHFHEQMGTGTSVFSQITPSNTYGYGVLNGGAGNTSCEYHDELCPGTDSGSKDNTYLFNSTYFNYNSGSWDPAESIATRLLNALNYLSANDPSESSVNWAQFVSAGNVVWSQVTLAGHSQGAGHAAYMGKHLALARVIMLSGPIDSLDYYQAKNFSGCSRTVNSGGVSPTWLTDNDFNSGSGTHWQTSLSQFFSLANLYDQDYEVDSHRTLINWNNITLDNWDGGGVTTYTSCKSDSRYYPSIDGYQSSNFPSGWTSENMSGTAGPAGPHGLLTCLNNNSYCAVNDSCTSTQDDQDYANSMSIWPHDEGASNEPEFYCADFTDFPDKACGNSGGTESPTDTSRTPVVKAWDYMLSYPLTF